MSSLEKRSNTKKKKPQFKAQDAHKHKKIKQRWRKPKGLQSKMRLAKKGYNKTISHGWRSPNDVRGTNPQGLYPVVVYNAREISIIDAKTHAVIIASSVSTKNKLMIQSKAKEQGIIVMNRKIDSLPARIEERKKAVLQAKKEKQERKEATKKTDKKKKKDKETKEEVTEEKAEKPAVAQEKAKEEKKTDTTESQEPKKEPNKDDTIKQSPNKETVAPAAGKEESQEKTAKESVTVAKDKEDKKAPAKEDNTGEKKE